MAAENFKVKKGLEVGTGSTITSGGINVTGVITATQLVGDGSGLTTVVGSGSGLVVKDVGSSGGPAGTGSLGGSGGGGGGARKKPAPIKKPTPPHHTPPPPSKGNKKKKPAKFKIIDIFYHQLTSFSLYCLLYLLYQIESLEKGNNNNQMFF